MKVLLQSFIVPLVMFCIFADTYCWLRYDVTVSDILYYDGETLVYVSFVSAFLLYVIFGLNEFQKKVLKILLSGWLPFCANAVYRQLNDLGMQKSITDFYSLIFSGIIVLIQIGYYGYKYRKSRIVHNPRF